MADGVLITPGLGATVATDDAGGAGHVQIVKLAIAADGSATVLPGDATDGLLVNLGANNDVVATPRPAATATLANVSGSASSVTLIASNAARLGAIIVNDSTASCYLKYGSTATATSFTYLLQPGAIWEMPANVLYTGIITGIWSSATGSARTTELTA